MKTPPKILYLLFILFGVFILGLLVWNIIYGAEYRKNRIKKVLQNKCVAAGIIRSIENRNSFHGYYYIFKVKDKIFTNRVGNDFDFAVGDTLSIWYNCNDPDLNMYYKEADTLLAGK